MIDYDEIKSISLMLESKCSLFRQFWDIGLPYFSEDISTAAISFNKDGDAIDFLINESFWKELDLYTKVFITCHEMLHILLNHGSRMLIHKNNNTSNVAMDLVVNHMLINEFGFDREKLSIDWKKYCWVDTVFELSPPLTNKSYEYYYSLLNTNSENSQSVKLLDSHGVMADSSKDISENLNNSIITSDISDDLLNKIKDHILSKNIFAGDGLGKKILLKPKTKIIKKWEKLLKPNIPKMVEKREFTNSWIHKDRRLQDLTDNHDDIFLENRVMIVDKFKENIKTKILFFLDYSGSCVPYKEIFLNAAESLSKNKFEVELFTFDVVSHKAKKNKQGKWELYGGGGTKFSAIEQEVNKTNPNESTYVWVITDGYSSDKINPLFPENWYWFLIDRSTVSYIPPQSKTFKLSDFV